MRKLLVLSQKGGVGKTTTTLNLATAAALTGKRILIVDSDPIGSVAASLTLASDHTSRQAAADLALPGSLWDQALSGLDVLVPYSHDQFDEQELSLALQRLDLLARKRGYDVVFMDAPPSLWQRSRLLLQAATEVLIVLRCEPLAYRSLPGLLTMIKNSGKQLRLSGILLTLPVGQEPGSTLETEMLAKLGKQALSVVIPFDSEASEALLVGLPLVQHNPNSKAAIAYLKTARHLGLIASVEDFQRSLIRLERKSRTSLSKESSVDSIAVPRPRLSNKEDLLEENCPILMDPSLPFTDQRERSSSPVWKDWLSWVMTSILVGIVGAAAMRWFSG